VRTPKELTTALRQFRHNNSDEFVFGFDHDEMVKIWNTRQDDWIPVSEKPEKGGIAVDVWSEGDDYHEAGRYTDCLHINGNSYFEADDERQQIIPNVTHWKPITPPKEVE